MHQGDRVRFRPGSTVPAGFNVPANSTGTVLAAYALLARLNPPARECVDVAIGRDLIIWGLRADQLEVVVNTDPPSKT